ncbi:hypothetical protein BH23VER1_BH23VER1_26630 [soil metagenome]
MPAHTPTLAALAALAILSGHATAGFEWVDTEGKFADLKLDGKNVARYVYETIDESSDERREETYKPFHHVYDAEGEDFITKGPGGKYTHHRGIYYGFSKCRYTREDGKEFSADTWHCSKPAHQTHEKFIDQMADDDSASHKVAIDWHGQNDGEVFATEERELAFRKEGDALVVDFTSTLSTDLPKVVVDGDPQHAGFQFRASNEVAENTAKQTTYLRPDGQGKPGQTLNWPQAEGQIDLPWKAMSFVVGGDRYSTLYLDHPTNPKPAMSSERDYGRFGSYFVAEITPDKPLTVPYRLVVKMGAFAPEEARNLSEEFAN